MALAGPAQSPLPDSWPEGDEHRAGEHDPPDVEVDRREIGDDGQRDDQGDHGLGQVLADVRVQVLEAVRKRGLDLPAAQTRGVPVAEVQQSPVHLTPHAELDRRSEKRRDDALGPEQDGPAEDQPEDNSEQPEQLFGGSPRQDFRERVARGESLANGGERAEQSQSNREEEQERRPKSKPREAGVNHHRSVPYTVRQTVGRAPLAVAPKGDDNAASY